MILLRVGVAFCISLQGERLRKSLHVRMHRETSAVSLRAGLGRHVCLLRPAEGKRAYKATRAEEAAQTQATEKHTDWKKTRKDLKRGRREEEA